MLWASPPAGAHALLVSSEPSDGAGLQGPPSAVTLTFTEEPDVRLSTVTVLDSDGRKHERGALSAVEGEPRKLRVAVGGLDRGVFTVSWRVVSRVDGHFTAGAYAFGVRVDPTAIERAATTQPKSAPIQPLEAAGRFLLYLGLLAAAGSAWVGGLLFPDTPSRARRLLLGGGVVALIGLVVLAIAQRDASGAPWDSFLGAPIGRAVIGRVLGLIALGAGVLLVLRTRMRRIGSVVAVAAAFWTIAVHASAGHADTGEFAAVKVATQLVHFGAATVWIGGLAALLAAVGTAPDETKARAVRRFSIVAGVSLAVVAGTGVARAIAEVGSWRALVQTSYGKIVIAKIAGGGTLALLGARNRWWSVPRAPESLRGLRRVSRVELSVAGAVLALTAVLSSLVPAKSVSLARPSSIELTGSDFAESVRVRLEIAPGSAGANVFTVRPEVLRGPKAVRGITLRLSSRRAGIADVPVRLRRRGEEWTARSAGVPLPGTWQVVVFVDRGADSVEIPLRFHTRCPTPAPSGPSTPRIYDIRHPDGTSVQTYADPGRPGRNEVHFTFFDAEGKELPMADDPRIDGFLESSKPLDVRRFSAGHFVAGARLGAGEWIFDFDGQTRAGDALTVCFSDEIR
ncbi:MAG TPA: copper resistance protein CopC [Actinomycetota bacterium]|jgi:copper transport protein|nr:copper resistance protein CopC [Actinomycetota bacterium]